MDKTITNFVALLYDTMQTAFRVFTFSINSVLANHGLDITVPLIGDWSLIELMFGGGFVLFVGYTLLKWVVDLIL